MINLGLPDLVELPMDGSEAGVKSLVISGVCGVANTDQIAFGTEETAAAAAINGLTRRGEVGFAFVLVDRRDMRGADAGLGALVATNAEGTIARADCETRRSDFGGLGIGAAFHANQSDITVEIVTDELSIDRLRRTGSKDVGRDLALSLRFAE